MSEFDRLSQIVVDKGGSVTLTPSVIRDSILMAVTIPTKSGPLKGSCMISNRVLESHVSKDVLLGICLEKLLLRMPPI